jgi:hypothetical protein
VKLLPTGDEHYDNAYYPLRGNGFGLGLKLGYGNDVSVREVVTKFIFKHDEVNDDYVFLPGCENQRQQSMDTNLFHRDNKGLVAFTADEADTARDYFASMKLEERVKACTLHNLTPFSTRTSHFV